MQPYRKREYDMGKLNDFSMLTSSMLHEAAEQYGTPVYVYDEAMVIQRCRAAMAMPNAYGLQVRYAMKANSNRTLLQIIDREGLLIDSSSLNEAKRAIMAGIAPENIFLTTQEVPAGKERRELEDLMKQGMLYNVCSVRQLELIADFAREQGIDLSMRIHPGIGSGESAARNTGDDYSCFGVHSTDLERALAYAKEKGVRFTEVHVHIGSGGDPEIWRSNIDLELGIIEEHFPDCEIVSFGGGLKEARMPGETYADIEDLGNYAKKRIEEFYERTGRKLLMEIEPGTFIVANAGYAVTRVIDRKKTGDKGFDFVVVDGGMEINARPLTYGSVHPFYVIANDGTLRSSEFDLSGAEFQGIIVGRCCESGDSQSLDDDQNIVERTMAEPMIDDLLVIGGTGAYCSAMTPFNYNSHTQIPEVLVTTEGDIKLIRRAQTLEQIVENEL